MILTDEEILQMDFDSCRSISFRENQRTFARAIESAVLRKLRERPADAYIEHHKAGDNLIWTEEKISPQVTPLHIIPEEHE